MKKRNAFNLQFALALLFVTLMFSSTVMSQFNSQVNQNYTKEYVPYFEEKPARDRSDVNGVYLTGMSRSVVPDPQFAAFNNYTAVYSTGITYTPVYPGGSNFGTWRNAANTDDNMSNTIPIGFTFVYNGIPYTSFRIATNGFLTFNTTTTSLGNGTGVPYSFDNTFFTNTNCTFNTLAGFYEDLVCPGNPSTQTSLDTSFRYILTGITPNQVLTVEYRGLEEFNLPGPNLNWQVKLYEADGHIEFVYGTMDPTGGSFSYTLGINGTTMSAVPTIAELLTQQVHNTGTFSNTPQNSLATVPAANSQVTFNTPAAPNGSPSALTFSNISFSSVKLTWNDNSTNEIGFPVMMSTDGGATYNYVGSAAAGGGSTQNITINGLTPVTTYFFKVFAATEGRMSPSSANGSTTTIAAPPPLCGIKNIPGDYATLTDCIADLNASGITCPTIINIAPGYTETNVNLTLTCPVNPPNSTNTLIFRKNGSGVNPLLTAGVGTSTTVDGIIKLNGVKYVTFDGIDLQENPANVDATTQMEWGYALVKQSGTLGCQNITIKNCAITLNKTNVNSVGIYTGNHTALNTTALTVTNFNGTGSYNKFYSNTVQNCFIGIKIQGFAAATPFDLYDQGNEVGTTGGGRNQVLNFGNGTSATSAYGIFTINQNAVKIFSTYVNSTGGTNNNALLNGIFLGLATNGSADVYNDTVTVVGGGTTQQLMGIACDMGNAGNGNTLNFYNNVVTGCSYPTATTGEFRGISTGATSTSNALATYTNIYNNKVTGNTLSGTGVFQGIGLDASSSAQMVTANVYNNEVSGNTKTGTGGVMYMFFCSSSCQTLNIYNNLGSANSNATSSAATYGIYSFAFPFVESIHDNQITNSTGGTGEFAGLFVAGGSGPTNKDVYNNTVSGITGSAAASGVGGIFVDRGTVSNVYKNNVFNLTNNNTTLSPGVYGIQLGINTNVFSNIYNNFVSDLKAPSSTALNAIYGLYLQGPAAGNNINVYYNTVYLNAVSSSVTSFGTACVAYINTTAASNLDLRNNVIVNVSTPGPTGGTTKAFQRSTTTLTNYNLISGNNCFYAGTPGPTRLIYTDGTNLDQTLQAFKDRVSPRDQASFTELPPFVNIATTPYDLHMQTGTGTQVEKGGQPVAITVDYDGTTRNATFPDAGADEFTGTFTDNASPLITYAPLGNSDASSPRVAGSISITDPSGINVTAGTKPRIYYKKSTNANTFVDNTNATDGWKFVEASNAASPFSFNMDYTLINGGLAAGNIIQYFVVAQDLNGTPRIGLNSGAFTTQPTSVNLAAANFPLTGTINQYTITAGAGLSGTVNVGSTETITSLTNTGGAFALINSSSLSGNLVLNITSDLSSELGTVALNQWSETGSGGYTVTIQSSAATMRTIQGITNSNGMVRLDGADRVNIDGRVGGTGQFLRFRNFSTSGPSISLINDAQNNMIRNCILEGNSTAVTGLTAGVVNIGTTTGLLGNDNNTITFNEIRDRSDSTKFPAIGISSTGTTTSLPQYNDNCVVSNNNIHDYFLDGNTLAAGINVLAGTSSWAVDSNSLYMAVPKVFTLTGSQTTGINISNSALVASNGNYRVRSNYIGGSAPLAGGTPLSTSIAVGTATYIFRGINVVTGQIPNVIRANTIANIDYASNSTASNTIQFNGISTGNGIHNITKNVIGSPAGNDNIKFTLSGTGAGFTFIRLIGMNTTTGTVFGGNMDSNSAGSITLTGPTTGGGAVIEGISLQGGVGLATNVSISNNLIGSTTTANSIRTTYTAGTIPGQFIPIRNLSTGGGTITINGNTIQNLTEASASTTNGLITCILSANAGANNPVITNNTVANISNNTAITTTNSIAGISVTTPSSSLNISGNTIFSLNTTNTTAGNEAGAIGIFLTGNNNTNGIISKNKIYGLTNQTIGGVGLTGLTGMSFNAGNQLTISNNMISITNGEAANLDAINSFNNKVPVSNEDNTFRTVLPGYEVPAGYKPEDTKVDGEKTAECIPAEMYTGTDLNTGNNNTDRGRKNGENLSSSSFTNNLHMYGIYDQTNSSNLQLLYNTIYLGGTSTGSLNANCYHKTQNSYVTLKNNLLYNNRVITGGGFAYAVSNISTTPSAGWLANASNYNVLVAPDSTHVGEWGTGNAQTIAQWRTSSSGDNMTWYAKTTEISPTSLFTSLATGDLHINSSNSAAWLVSGKGIALGTLGTDYDGNSRSTSIAGGVTDIGADEFTATPPSSPNALQSGAPSSGGTTDYTLYGRKICTINWGTGGTYPTSMNVAYNSGVSPAAPNVTNPNRTSNSFWTANPVGTFSGTTYDITWYYGDNETFTITNPATNILLGKNDNTFWMTYPQGTGNLQSESTPAAYSVKVRGLFRFSSFTLSDASLPAEFPRTPLNNSIVATASPTLVWSKSALATSYRVQLATDSLFNTIIVNDSTVTDTTKLVSGLVNGQNYWWRVNGKISLGNVGGWSQVFKFTCITVLPPALVNLKVIPGGFYNLGSGQLNMRDTVRAILVDSATCLKVDSSRIVIDSVTFSGQLSFANAPTGNYYLFIFHRNHIPIATRLKQTVTRGSTVSYDFTTDSAKIFGFNAIKLAAGVWGMIPGDANRDQFVDGLDQTIWLLENGLDGYLPSDFNGDRFVDGLDQTIWLLYNGNSSFLPCNITALDPVSLENFMKKHEIKMIDNQKAFEIMQENAAKNREAKTNSNNNDMIKTNEKNINDNGTKNKNSNSKQNK